MANEYSYPPGMDYSRGIIEVDSGGVRVDASEAGALCRTPEAAVRLWHRSMMCAGWGCAVEAQTYPANIAIRWRTRPKIQEIVLYEHNAAWRQTDPPEQHVAPRIWYTVYSRLSMYAKPPPAIAKPAPATPDFSTVTREIASV